LALLANASHRKDSKAIMANQIDRVTQKVSPIDAPIAAMASCDRTGPRIFAISGGSSMQAMTRNVPPQSGQASMSMAKTRLRRCIYDIGFGCQGLQWVVLSHTSLSMTKGRSTPGSKHSNRRSDKACKGRERPSGPSSPVHIQR
jgi:hypothetical protein